MGAEVSYDQVWDKNSKLYIVTISVNDEDYRVARFQKNYAIFHNEELILLTHSVGYDLVKMFEEIFSFSVYLPNKTTKKIEMAPPAFTFMPYYIDQDTGWSGLYNRNLLGGLYRENPVKSRNYEAVKSSKKWENVGNSYIIPALLLYRYSYI